MKRSRRYVSATTKRRRKKIRLVVLSSLVLGVIIVLVFFTPSAIDKITSASKSISSFFGRDSKKSPEPSEIPSPMPTLSVDAQEGILPILDPAALAAAGDLAYTSSDYTSNNRIFHVDATVRNDRSVLDVVQQLDYTNELNMPIREIRLSLPTYELLTNMPNPFSRVVVNSESVLENTTIDGQVIIIKLEKEISPMQTAKVTLAFSIRLPEGSSMPGQNAKSIRLNGFYAFPLMFEGDSWTSPSLVPPLNFEANITYPKDFFAYASAPAKSRSTLDSALRTLFTGDDIRGMTIFAHNSSDRVDEKLTGSTLVTSVAPASSRVLRVAELSSAIIPHSEARYGSFGKTLLVAQSDLGNSFFFGDGVILFSDNAFDRVNEFRYQLCLGVARQYFPEASSKTPSGQALNDMLAHELAASYVIKSQGNSEASFAYGHLPAAKEIAAIRASMDENAFDEAVRQYIISGASSYYNPEALYSALPPEIATVLMGSVAGHVSELSSVQEPQQTPSAEITPSPSPTN